jgi:hypothetical protein
MIHRLPGRSIHPPSIIIDHCRWRGLRAAGLSVLAACAPAAHTPGGAEHGYWLRGRLRSRDDVRLLDPEALLLRLHR